MMFIEKSTRLRVFYTNYRYSSVMAWSNKLFVNYLKLPSIKGPTADEVTENVDLTNKTCLITGGTSGIGVEIVRCLMSKNCDVVMACRNPYAAHVLSNNVWGDSGKLKTYKTNLVSLESVKNASNEILNNEEKIDIVILNAAVFALPWTLTRDEFETTFQVNYLSQFLLLLNIEKIIAPDARIVFMSAKSHRNISWTVEDTVQPTRELIDLPKDRYTSIKAYNISKLCGIFAMHYLTYRWSNTARSVFCAHPGSFIKTKLCTNWWPYELLYTFMYPFSKSIPQAAATPLYCATSPSLQGYSDSYFKDCKEAEMSALAHDRHLSFRVADLSLNLLKDCGVLEERLEVQERTEFKKQPEEIKAETPKSTIIEPELTT